MLTGRAGDAKQRGVSLQDRFLGNTDLVGRLGTLTARLANWANTLAPHRAFLQAVVGLHRRRTLPSFARERFSAWFSPRPPVSFVPQAKVALFATCTVEYNDPAVGKAAVAVLERNRVDVALPPQRCWAGAIPGISSST